jgi:quercetin dioxygenase-like cupin family protein
MKTKVRWYAAMWLLPVSLAAQAPAVITMDKEPHHHLALNNEYVKVFKVEVSPGDSIILHRHYLDTIAIAIGDQEVTVGIPGKPDVHQKNADAQIRLQRAGYEHSTHVEGNTPYHTVAVELLRPQTNFHNVCAAVLPDEPMNCPDPPANSTSDNASKTLLESGETRVRLLRIPPGENVILGGLKYATLIVALDPANLSATSDSGADQTLKPGDFLWFADGGASQVFKNNGKSEVRAVLFVISPVKGKGTAAPAPVRPPRRLKTQ